jgi:DNA-binding protein HU-beta
LTIAAELAAGRDVAIAGFGKFSVTERAAREGRNIATGETIQIAASRAAKFSAAAALKAAAQQLIAAGPPAPGFTVDAVRRR